MTPFDLLTFTDRLRLKTGLLLVLIGGLAAAQEAPVRYSVSFDQREHHEATIKVLFEDLGSKPLDLRMSRSSPGRYRLHEFAKNVYGITAKDGLGEALVVESMTPSSWRVKEHHGTVEVTYTLFGDLLSGTYSAIESRLAVLNPPATFMWAKGLEKRPVEVRFDLPLGWSVVSQMPEGQAGAIEAPDLAYFLDSPIGLGTFDSRTWRVDSQGRPLPLLDEMAQDDQSTEPQTQTEQSIRLAVHHQGETALVGRYQEQLKGLVAEAGAVFGELPDFEYGRYTFIANYLPFAHNDAMEHRNSTVHSSPESFKGSQKALLHTIIHEFFHIWNVERIRPRSLEPFDFEDLNPSSELWFAEGFTNYYDSLLMVRAGASSLDDFLNDLSVTVNRFMNSPARRFGGAAYMSRRAAFNDRAAWVDPRNEVNTYLHYYFYGEALALALDLELRSQFSTTLDAFMQRVWEEHGVGGLGQEKPYSNSDLEELLTQQTNVEFASQFFESFIAKGGAPDFDRLLSTVGLAVARSQEGKPWLGFAGLTEDSRGVVVQGPTRIGSPLYEAGLGQGDRVLELGTRKLEGLDDVEKALKRQEPGGTIRLVSERRNEWREGSLSLGEDPTLEVVVDPARTNETTAAAREAWIGSQVAPRENAEALEDTDASQP